MIKKLLILFLPVIALAILAATQTQAQQHVARRLGHPTTRFADPLHTPADLRDRLTSEKLSDDVAVIVNLCEGWQGDIADFRQAAATAPITSLQIPVGARLPAMSSRDNGKPILLRDVLWGGKEPIDAYEFFFYSKGRHYRCVTPKACCNFWIEYIGPDNRVPILSIECNTPLEASVLRPIRVCLTVKNVGDATDELITVTLPIPAGAIFTSPAGEANTTARRAFWRIRNLAPGMSKQLCADFTATQPCILEFGSSAHGTTAEPVQALCATRVTGLPAVLFEVVDIADPVEVGQQETYELSVVNQGSSVLTNVVIICTLEDSQQFVSGSGATDATARGRTITFAPLAELSPKDTAKWQVVVKSLSEGDVRFAAELTSDQFKRSITETEATRQY